MVEITKPTLLLNEQVCRSNIKKLADKAHQHRLEFKPHMKTHQSAKIGEWLRKAGVEAVTVSSVTMALYFADHGWNDITIAFPCNTTEIDNINALAKSISLTILVNNEVTARKLQQQLAAEVKVYIEIDTGSSRTGLKVKNTSAISDLIQLMDKFKKLQWIGFYSHPGHSYQARSKEEILEVHEEVLNQFQELRKNHKSHQANIEICMGDTPCCSVANDFGDIDAISPGNFIFYDVMQHRIGSCDENNIAAAVACPIVETYPERNEIAIYGGAVHFSKESLQEETGTHFGIPATKREYSWEFLEEHTSVKALSQEHGLVSCSDEMMEKFSVGDVVYILPVHSCLTANLIGEYYLLDGTKISRL